MTQKKAYELIIKEITESPGGLKTITNLEKVKEQMKDFIWKIIHGRIKCGTFFRFIPGWQEKEFCACGASESIEHILLMCEESGQNELWKLMKDKLEKETGVRIGTITMGMIMGIGCYEMGIQDKMEGKPATDLM